LRVASSAELERHHEGDRRKAGQSLISVGVIGYGYWGPNLVRNFAEASRANIVAVADLRPDRVALACSWYPSLRGTTRPEELIYDPAIDAVVIASPVATHFPLAYRALQAGKHVLVEKPMALTSQEGQELVDLAAALDRVLLVDHTFVYNPAVKSIHDMISTNGLGELYYYDSVRVNLGLFQRDVNVIWDLAVHDLSIIDYVLPFRPCAISATASSHVPNGHENIAYMTLFFENHFIAHIHVNWLAPVKIRRVLIGGARKMIVYDDLDPSEKIRVYDKGVTVGQANDQLEHQLLIGYRAGDMWAPHLDVTEALHVEVEHFLDCIEFHDTPVSDGHAGVRVIEILEAATQSLAARGNVVELKPSTVPV
jgi:predicted dehydrogenase